MEVNDIKRVTILGAGLMGHGIAQISAVTGFDVTVRDVSQEFLDRGRQEIEKSLRRLVERGRMTQDAAKATLGRIGMMVSLPDAVKGADLVIEAIPENLELKRNVWREVSDLAKDCALLATNTSSISITKIAEAVKHPQRFFGMHFFNPPVVMRLVEVIPGAKTSAETLKLAEALAVKMGKTPVAVKKDSPGFVVNRVLVTYLNDAAKLLDGGRWTKEQIDGAMQYRAKMPMGPFMLSDLIGMDIVYNILKVFEEDLGKAYKPAKSIEALFKANKLGRKTGEGFYSYREQPTASEKAGEGFDVNLLLRPFVAEAEKVVKEGVADREVVDTAMKLGANLPAGPFEMAKNLGWSPK